MNVNTSSTYTFEDVHLYGPPNPALAKILLGPRLQSIMAGYTARVLSVFLALEAAEPYQDPYRQFRAGGHEPGQLMRETTASVDVGPARPGMVSDRWCGQITVGVVYAGAEFYGRQAYAQYAGNRNLQQALHAVLPSRT